MKKQKTPQDHFQDFISSDLTFQFKMLGRLQSDLKYYFGYGDRNEKHLWCSTIKDHLELTKLLRDKLNPEWFTEEEFKHYEDQF